MLLNFIKKEQVGVNGTEEIAAKLDQSQERIDFFSLATRALLQVIREFALDLREINSDEIQDELSELAERLMSSERLSRLQTAFDRSKKRFIGFAGRQKNYLIEREKEFRDIIDLLTKAVISLDSDNDSYNRKILEQSEKMEQITLLDDIKKIKQALIQEVEQLRSTVRRKESRDGTQLESLAKKVTVLDRELKKVRRESERDGLTGAFNRQAFDQRLLQLVEKNTAMKAPFSLMMLDVDDFKRINDTFGHQTGDRALVALVNNCLRYIRSEDTLARYGGDEFAMILPGASLRNAVKKAKQICQAVASTRYAVDGRLDQQPLSMTISVGVAVLRKADTVATLIERADRSLLSAKREGKNRVVSEKQVPDHP